MRSPSAPFTRCFQDADMHSKPSMLRPAASPETGLVDTCEHSSQHSSSLCACLLTCRLTSCVSSGHARRLPSTLAAL